MSLEERSGLSRVIRTTFLAEKAGAELVGGTMKAPFRATNSSTIEKLRVWLAAELEPLEINNNIQYAHHVVTIFLNDADVEDEPLSPPDDYLRELDNLRAGKSLDQKKKAAVQFLKGVIPFENQPIQCLIEQLIEELVERVDATRVKTPKKVLCPINVNVEITRRQCGYKKNRMEQESFEEAFPSLPAETRVSAVTVTIKKDVSADGWAKSTSVSDSNQRNRRRSTATRRITFVDKSEDAVCSKTGLLHLLPLPDKQPSPVTIQVDESSFQTGIFSGGAIQLHYEAEWKSAFMKVKPTATLYSPKKFRFPVPQIVSPTAGPKSLQPVTVLRHDGLNQPTTGILSLAHKVDLLNERSPKVFLHMEKRAPEMPVCTLFALDADDLEVSNVISWSSINSEQLKRRRNELVQKKRLEAQVVRASRKERKDSSRQSHASGGNSSGPSRQRNGEHHQSSPLLGAVGGSEEVKTDDLLGFAMTQMANFEKNRSGTGGYGTRQDAFEGDGNALAIPIPIGGGRAGGEDEGNGRDSGMVAGGEDDSWRRNLFGWANGRDASSSGWLEPASVWQQAPATAPWRKTPGGPGPGEDDVERQGRVSPLQANGSAVVNDAAEDASGQARQDWDGWRDPWSVSGPSWDSMIWGDVYNMSTPPQASDAVATMTVDDETIYTPPELSSCVDDNVSQILQSAFVNSMFAQASPSVPMGEILGSPKILDCSELEERWLFNGSDEALPMASRSRFLNVVKGKTCSNFLEGICRLGLECPFSHPSI